MVIETIIPSDFMYQFYMEYRDWAWGGAKDTDPVFRDYRGLCGNLSAYAQYQAVDIEVYNQLHKELEDALEKVYGDIQFPFDNGDAHVYYGCTNKHLNTARMLFVDAMIMNYEGAHSSESV
nr:MAG TPA: hypothetical protein [Caudoviricetes sp.]